MNRTNIEYCDFTWNPVTGCRHGCDYCYARRFARRYYKTPEGKAFKPVFHPERLGQPQRVKKPSTVFVCSMADLFGEWVSSYWIEQIMEACRKAPQHTYLFLTKNPSRYRELMGMTWPERYMVGSTSTGDTFGCATYHHPDFSFISFEPLLGPISSGFWTVVKYNCSWVIIGAMTGPGAVNPERKWIEEILYQSMKQEIPVFMKNNLQPVWQRPLIQEYPKAFEGVGR